MDHDFNNSWTENNIIKTMFWNKGLRNVILLNLVFCIACNIN